MPPCPIPGSSAPPPDEPPPLPEEQSSLADVAVRAGILDAIKERLHKLPEQPSGQQVLGAIGEFGDVAHNEAAHAKAALAALGGSFHSPLLVRQRVLCFGQWVDAYGATCGGKLFLFKYPGAPSPHKVLQMDACTATVGERDGCKTDSYCFSVVVTDCACEGGAEQAPDAITLCATSSKELLLWLQALVAAGCKYADGEKQGTPLPESLFGLSANDLDHGKAIDFSEYKGCVCLVVNVASK